MPELNSGLNETPEDIAKEHEEIQKEIEAQKGGDPKPKGDPEVRPEAKPEEKPDEGGEDKDDKGDEQVGSNQKGERPAKYIPIDQWQDFKKKTEAEKEEWISKEQNLKKQVEELNEKLKESSTTSELRGEVEKFAEKHGITDSAWVYDLANIVGKGSGLSSDQKAAIETAQLLSAQKKQETEVNSEIDALAESYPDEAISEHKDAIRKLAFTKGYLDKSPFEIYFRHVKPDLPAKKKTAESGNAKGGGTKFVDFKSIAERLQGGETGVLESLSGEEQDKFFEWAEKTGSRYVSK